MMSGNIFRRGSVTLTWPLPALLTWAASWSIFIGLRWLQAPMVHAVLAAALLSLSCSLFGSSTWRRIFIAWGFPLSLAASGVAGAVPAWAWLLPLALLSIVYPLNSWRDAPLFPTPRGALSGLGRVASLRDGARIVDAGCGLGDGLRELRREYPNARLVGLEWSWPLRYASAWRARFASVQRADIWTADWSEYDMVYLFQRPESMPRAAEKAERELRAGAWMASLEFSVPTLLPQQMLRCSDGRCVWLYQLPFRRR